MTTDVKKLAERLRVAEVGEAFQTEDGSPELQRTELGLDAADALEAMAGEVERLKASLKDAQGRAHARALLEGAGIDADGCLAEVAKDFARKAIAAEAERDRLKAALEALEAVRSDLPEKVSEQWLYEGVRHWHRNCDWDDPGDGSPLDRGDGATVAKILNMIPRKALGDAS